MKFIVLSPADDEHHIDKRGEKFKVPFVCGARNLGEALRRIAEGAAMIRTKGEAGTGKLIDILVCIILKCIVIIITMRSNDKLVQCCKSFPVYF